jgi:hypothetical protein
MVDYVLQTSLIQHQDVTIIYLKGTEFTKRRIRVTEIKDDIVEAYCYLRHQQRKFKKDNILSAEKYIH